MKILIYGINYAPDLIGIGKYTGEMGSWMAKRGHEIHVVTALPYYPAWKISSGYSALQYKCEISSGVKIWRCPLYVPRKPSGSKRILHFASFALSSIPLMARQILWKPDIIILIAPPLFCSPFAWLCAKLSGAKCWLHIQDFEIDVAFNLGLIPFTWIKKPVRVVEDWILQQFDTVSTISKTMVKRLQQKNVAKPILFPNWSNLSHIIYDEVGRKSFRAEVGIGSKDTLCLYSGNIAVKQELKILVEAAEQLSACRFVICGDGANKKFLQNKVQKLKLTNILFIDLQPLDRLSAMLSGADIHLILQKAGAADLVMPSKLTNIMAVGGVAVVAAEYNSELGQLGEGEQACLYRCDPENTDALIDAITTLRNNKKLSSELGTRAKKYADNHISMKRILGEFESECKSLIA